MFGSVHQEKYNPITSSRHQQKTIHYDLNQSSRKNSQPDTAKVTYTSSFGIFRIRFELRNSKVTGCHLISFER